MADDLAAGGELATRLQSVVGPKLVEVGWSSGLEDDNLTEYIILMLANGKSQEEIASELSTDLLGLGPEDQSTKDFSRWLFEQVDVARHELSGASTTEHAPVPTDDISMDMTSTTAQDAEMSDSSKSIPTGPKSMRGGRGGGRIINQVNKAMDRSDPLRRVQGGGRGVGRINSHGARGARGGGNQIQRNFDGVARRANNNQQLNPNQPSFVPMQGTGAPDVQAQQQFLQMMEEHARMMSQMAAQHGFMNPSFSQSGFPQQDQNSGKSLFDRTTRGGRGRGNRGRQHNNNRGQVKDSDVSMGNDENNAENGTAEESRDPSQVMCKWNHLCSKPDCQFAHQSPAAAPGVLVDTTSECSYGVACKNFKCVSRHPSPAKKMEHQQQVECKFGPYCQNPKCLFKHTNSAPCRNGADCTVEGCTFYHNTTECKFNPCTNIRCVYKHKPGQKAVTTNVWKANGDNKDHISDRKFVNDQEEEVIIPGAALLAAEPGGTAMTT